MLSKIDKYKCGNDNHGGGVLANFYAALRARFADRLNAPFLRPYGAPALSYENIDAQSAQFASALRSIGAKPGDRIVVQVEKSPANVALYLAALRSGVIYVPLNTAYTAAEVEYFLQDAEPSVFICDPPRREELSQAASRQSVDTVLTLDGGGAGSFAELTSQSDQYSEILDRSDDDIAVILYTSGTTGRSKGAMLTHENLRSNAESLHDLWGFSPSDSLIHALPVFHIHGLFVALHTSMWAGSAVHFLPKFEATKVVELLPDATVMMGVPTFYARLLNEPDFSKEVCADMRLFISGSAPLTSEIFSKFAARAGHNILERYGMSEAGMIASNPLDGDRVASTVGYALPNVEIRIRNKEKLALPGETGMVEIKGPNVFKGYWRMPEKTTAEFTNDRLFHYWRPGLAQRRWTPFACRQGKRSDHCRRL